jgi:hypothetical protein
MPGSPTTPDRPGTRDDVRRLSCLPFGERRRHPGLNSFAAQWLAYALPCRRFAHALASMHARLGADVDRYSFIAVDFHHLLLAGLPAHSPQSCTAILRSHLAEIPGCESINLPSRSRRTEQVGVMT